MRATLTRSLVLQLMIGVAAVVAILGSDPHAQSQASAGQPGVPAPGNDGWIQLFNGRNLDGWYTFLSKSGQNNDPAGLIRVDNGMIHILGNPVAPGAAEAGYLATNQEFSDYRLRLEYKWGMQRFPPRQEMKRDNGLLFHLVGPDRVWPTCMEFQIQETDVGDAIGVSGTRFTNYQVGNGLAPWPNPPNGVTAAPAPQRSAYKLGDFEIREGWNVVELIARGDRGAYIVNGRIINTVFKLERPDPLPAAPPLGTIQNVQSGADTRMIPLDRGKIAIEIEYAETWIRSIAIRPLNDND